MKILLIPSDKGGGYGHISRCLVLAQEAQKRGHSCSFVLTGQRFEKLLSRDFPVFVAQEYKKQRDWRALFSALWQRVMGINPSQVLFTGFSTLDYQVIRDGLTEENSLNHSFGQYRDALHRFKPDLIIGDTNLMARTVAKKASLPIVQVVRYATHPDTNSIIWWDEKSDMMEPPDSLRLLNSWLPKIGQTSITRTGDMLRGDLYVVPSIPDLEPIPPDAQTMHVGQLSTRRPR